MYAMLVLMVLLGGCASGKVIYMEGAENASATIEVSMTGGRVMRQGPFKYCSEPTVVNETRLARAWLFRRLKAMP